jgi:hypothetical protein
VSAPEEVSLDELAVVVARKAAQLDARVRQITEVAGRLAELIEVNEALAVKAGPAGASAVAEFGELLEPAVTRRRPGQASAAGEEAGPRRVGTGAGKQPAAPDLGRTWRGPTTRRAA